MNNARSVNMIIGGLILIVCAAMGTGAYLAIHHAEAAVIVGIISIGGTATGGLVGLLANTASSDKHSVVTTSQDTTMHVEARYPTANPDAAQQ